MLLRRVLLSALLIGAAPVSRAENSPTPAAMIIVTGAPGTDEYGEQFQDWTKQWQKAAGTAGVQTTILGTGDAAMDSREKLQQTLKSQTPTADEPLWLVLIGHGTWDGKNAKFNVR